MKKHNILATLVALTIFLASVGLTSNVFASDVSASDASVSVGGCYHIPPVFCEYDCCPH